MPQNTVQKALSCMSRSLLLLGRLSWGRGSRLGLSQTWNDCMWQSLGFPPPLHIGMGSWDSWGFLEPPRHEKWSWPTPVQSTVTALSSFCPRRRGFKVGHQLTAGLAGTTKPANQLWLKWLQVLQHGPVTGRKAVLFSTGQVLAQTLTLTCLTWVSCLSGVFFFIF